MKLPDWIQELYLKETIYNSIKGEKTHDKHGKAASEAKQDSERNRKISEQLQPQKPAD